MRYAKKIYQPLESGACRFGKCLRRRHPDLLLKAAIPFARARLSTKKYASAIAVFEEQDIKDVNPPASPGFPTSCNQLAMTKRGFPLARTVKLGKNCYLDFERELSYKGVAWCISILSSNWTAQS